MRTVLSAFLLITSILMSAVWLTLALIILLGSSLSGPGESIPLIAGIPILAVLAIAPAIGFLLFKKAAGHE